MASVPLHVVIAAGENLAVHPLGSPSALMVTVPVNPPMRVSAILTCAPVGTASDGIGVGLVTVRVMAGLGVTANDTEVVASVTPLPDARTVRGAVPTAAVAPALIVRVALGAPAAPGMAGANAGCAARAGIPVPGRIAGCGADRFRTGGTAAGRFAMPGI